MKRKQIGEKSISIQEAFEQFQRFNQTKNLSPETIRYYDNHSNPFFAFLEDVFQPVDSITKEKIDAYILHLKAKGTVNDTTINTRQEKRKGRELSE